jgi:hypothetical protein
MAIHTEIAAQTESGLPSQVVIFDQYGDAYGEMDKLNARLSECRRWAEERGVRVREEYVEWVRDGTGTTWENVYPYHLLCALLT